MTTQTATGQTATDYTAIDYTATIDLDRSPEVVSAAIADVGRWWIGDVAGSADRIGAEFTYRYRDLHDSTQRVTVLEPGRRNVWDVIESELGFVAEPDPWTGTRIVFDLQPSGDGTRLTFTHEGLTPAKECYDACSAGWDHFIVGSLRRFVETGAGVPL